MTDPLKPSFEEQILHQQDIHSHDLSSRAIAVTNLEEAIDLRQGRGPLRNTIFSDSSLQEWRVRSPVR